MSHQAPYAASHPQDVLQIPRGLGFRVWGLRGHDCQWPTTDKVSWKRPVYLYSALDVTCRPRGMVAGASSSRKNAMSWRMQDVAFLGAISPGGPCLPIVAMSATWTSLKSQASNSTHV